MDDIADKTLQAHGFYISATGYLEKGSPRFIDVIDLMLNAKLTVMENPGLVITDSEEELIKKKNKRTVKRKERLAKLCVPIKPPSSLCPESSPLLSPCFVPVPKFALVPIPMPAPISRFGFPAILLSCHVPVPVFCPDSPAILSSNHTPVSCRGIPALLSSLFNMLGSPLLFKSSSLQTFKRFLSDKP